MQKKYLAAAVAGGIGAVIILAILAPGQSQPPYGRYQIVTYSKSDLPILLDTVDGQTWHVVNGGTPGGFGYPGKWYPIKRSEKTWSEVTAPRK